MKEAGMFTEAFRGLYLLSCSILDFLKFFKNFSLTKHSSLSFNFAPSLNTFQRLSVFCIDVKLKDFNVPSKTHTNVNFRKYYEVLENYLS